MPAPYRPPEQVIADWIAYYNHLHPGEVPSAGWLYRNTALGRACVYNYRREYMAQLKKTKVSTAWTVSPKTP